MRSKLMFLLLSIVSTTVSAQGIFDEKFEDCAKGVSSCLYCGNTPAHYTKQLTSYFKWKMEHSHNQYVPGNFDVLYEVVVDSAANTCVRSTKTIGSTSAYTLKDVTRTWLENMPDWAPAIQDNKPISSTVVIECKVVGGFLSMSYIAPTSEKLKRKDQE